MHDKYCQKFVLDKLNSYPDFIGFPYIEKSVSFFGRLWLNKANYIINLNLDKSYDKYISEQEYMEPVTNEEYKILKPLLLKIKIESHC